MATTPNLLLRYPAPSDPPDGSGAVGNLAADVEDRFGRAAATVGTLAAGTRYGQRAVVGSVEYRWNGTAWRPWDSDWAATTFTVVGVTISSGAGRWRYYAGRVKFEFGVQTNAAQTGAISITVPIPLDTSSYFTGTSPYQSGYAMNGRAWRYAASGRYFDLAPQFSGSVIAFAQANSAQYMDGLNGVTSGDFLVGIIEYDPA